MLPVLVPMTKCPIRSNLGEDGLILAPSLRIQSVHHSGGDVQQWLAHISVGSGNELRLVLTDELKLLLWETGHLGM